MVDYTGTEKPGSIVVDIDAAHLYLVQPDQKAIRYGVGVGRQGFSWKGMASVGRKGVWPALVAHQDDGRIKPELPPTVKRASTTRSALAPSTSIRTAHDTLFRIHGTNEPWSIGEQVSSGCVRMLNEDVADLYDRVPVGTTVYVKRNGRNRV